MYDKFLSRFTKSGAPVTDLSRFAGLMHALGDPQDELRFVHVAGTNGKGSVVRIISAALSGAGYKTGEFTSPYIYRYNDRIKINGEEIPDERIEQLIARIAPLVDEEKGYSQFEITTAIAFCYYLEEKCDVVVLEAGLGGLLDCTNIIKAPLCSVITSVSLDHTAILGDTVEKIAMQKAGIIKPGSPCVLYPVQYGGTKDIIAKKAAECGSTLIIPACPRIQKGSQTFELEGVRYTTGMNGVHQIYNAVTAIKALELLSSSFPAMTREDIQNAVSRAALPSRLQTLRTSPLVLIDGAHNEDAMKMLAAYVSTLENKPKIMICGMSRSKDYKASLSHISPFIDRAFCIDGFTQGTVPRDELVPCFADAAGADTGTAVREAFSLAGTNGAVIIAGSLYIPGAIIPYINDLP